MSEHIPGTLPLDGVRVLAVEQYGAGPFGTLFLADQGAEVIKIENPNDGGDMARGVGPHFFGPGDSHFFHAFNRNKRSVTLDLASDAGREVFARLVEDADAVTSNLRGDVPARLGLTYDTLREVNPKIVCAHLSAYGRDGPRASWPGYDYLMQAEAGYFSLTGETDGPPTRMGLSIVDLMTGLGLAYATLSALTAARATGIGRDIDVSLFDMALYNLGYVANWYLNCDVLTSRLPRSAHPSLTPCALHRTRDGWIFLMCNKEKFWPALCHAIDRPAWAEDARFATFADRLEHRDQVTEMLDEVLMTRDTSDWLERFGGTVPAAPINDVAQALDNPFVAERNRLQTLRHPEAGEYRMVATPIGTAGLTPPANPAPALGEHTRQVLRGAGFDDATLDALERDGVISTRK